jgi:hypothetical protein
MSYIRWVPDNGAKTHWTGKQGKYNAFIWQESQYHPSYWVGFDIGEWWKHSDNDLLWQCMVDNIDCAQRLCAVALTLYKRQEHDKLLALDLPE